MASHTGYEGEELGFLLRAMDYVPSQTTSHQTCPDRQLLILDAVHPELLPVAIGEQLFEHLCACGDCAKAYAQICVVDRDLAPSCVELGSDTALHAAGFMTQEEARHHLWQAIAEQESQAKRVARHRIALSISRIAMAFAACLMLVVLGGWLRSGHGGSSSTNVPKTAMERMKGAVQRAVVSIPPDLNEDSFDSIRDSASRVPDPLDVDTLVYAHWRDEHRQLSPDLHVPQVAERDQSDKADPIELLMVSGDIWQFHYDPKLPSNQPLAKVELLAIARLARHYELDERDLMRSVGLPDSTPIPILPIQGAAPGRQYAQAMHRWHDALAATGQETYEDNRNLAMFSLRASQFLANTRTAAYLWVRTCPQKAKELLADSGYRAMSPRVSMATDEKEWLKELHQQAMVARRCEQVAMEWLVIPAEYTCTSQATKCRQRLAVLVRELAFEHVAAQWPIGGSHR